MIGAVGVLKPLAGLNEYLDWIKDNGLKTAAVTNAPKANAEAMLKAIGLGDFFEHLILGETFEFPKPYPDPYLAALEKTGLQKHEALIHEDSPSGKSSTMWVWMSLVIACQRPPSYSMAEWPGRIHLFQHGTSDGKLA